MWIIPLIAVLVLAVSYALMESFQARRRDQEKDAPQAPRPVKPSTRKEHPALETALQELCGDDLDFIPNITLGDILDDRGVDDPRLNNFQGLRERRIDFLLVDKEEASPLVAIQVDQALAIGDKRSKRDPLIDMAMQKIEIPVLYLLAQKRYDVSKLRQRIEQTWEQHTQTVAQRSASKSLPPSPAVGS